MARRGGRAPRALRARRRPRRRSRGGIVAVRCAGQRNPMRSRRGRADLLAERRAGGGAMYGSPGIGPAMASRTAAVSRTVRVTTCSKVRPPRSRRSRARSSSGPGDGLRPTSPHSLAGMRIEPPMSLPCATGDHARRPPRPPTRRSTRRSSGRGSRGCGSGRTPAARWWATSASSGRLVLPHDDEPGRAVAARRARCRRRDVARRPSAPACRSGTGHPRSGRRSP